MYIEFDRTTALYLDRIDLFGIFRKALAAGERKRRMAEDDATQIELEQTLFQEQRVWFYHVPATHVSTLAPRADAWDPEHPFLTGSLQVLQKGDACWIRMFEPPKDGAAVDSGGERTLFAQCPVEISKELALELYVQDCADSSRYFMVRVEDEATKRRAYLGIGFPERASAFNFKAALQDYVKYIYRQMEVAAMAAQAAAGEAMSAEDGSTSPRTQDLSIPKGSTIRINLKVNSGASGENAEPRRRTSSEGQDRSAASPPKIPLLPPPPADPLALASPSNKTAQTSKPSTVGEDEDWGDFTSA
jgi:adaptin ear-binding coat-associated protein 1/2